MRDGSTLGWPIRAVPFSRGPAWRLEPVNAQELVDALAGISLDDVPAPIEEDELGVVCWMVVLPAQ